MNRTSITGWHIYSQGSQSRMCFLAKVSAVNRHKQQFPCVPLALLRHRVTTIDHARSLIIHIGPPPPPPPSLKSCVRPWQGLKPKRGWSTLCCPGLTISSRLQLRPLVPLSLMLSVHWYLQASAGNYTWPPVPLIPSSESSRAGYAASALGTSKYSLSLMSYLLFWFKHKIIKS